MSDDFRRQLGDLLTQARTEFQTEHEILATVANILDRWAQLRTAASGELQPLAAMVATLRQSMPQRPISGEEQVQQEWDGYKQQAQR